MKKTTNKLVLGDVMSSGEIVVACHKATPFGQTSPKMSVTLLNPKTNKRRIASWNYWGTIFLKEAAVKE